MDFRELSYVAAVAKYQNITKAAEALYISQPNLSKFLSNLENELGLKLFKRADKKYIPTYAGERYLDYARNILENKASLDAELADIIKRDVGVLNIGLPNMRCTFMLPKTLPAFNEKYPHVKINIFEGTSAAIDEKLLSGDVDLAFYSKPYEANQHIEYQTLATEELLICTRKNHSVKKSAVHNPASPHKKIDLAMLKDERLILLSPEQRTGQISRWYLQKSNINLNNAIITNNMPAVISLTEQGWGVSFMFESHLRWHLPTPEIETFSFGEPKVTSDFVAAFRKGSYLSVYAREFIEIAEKLYRK
ncbi:MAG: LysR family transcriptional regulator [Synergistaceae bacterium]|nr:LysR family transcriptional regulator [Synergistaceae bacterium]